MAEVILFHHALGQTDGVLAFADELRDAGHIVHTPDLFEGKTFTDVNEGVRHAGQEIGFDAVRERGRAAAEGVPNEVVYAGFSLGGMPAQELAQTRPGAQGALLFHSAIPASEFGSTWPEGVPLQIHIMESDPWAEEDIPAARELAENEGAELFLYPGEAHLFADNSTLDYDADAAALLKQRVIAFLNRVDAS
jgi:dienelactone hydrolase